MTTEGDRGTYQAGTSGLLGTLLEYDDSLLENTEPSACMKE